METRQRLLSPPHGASTTTTSSMFQAYDEQKAVSLNLDLNQMYFASFVCLVW